MTPIKDSRQASEDCYLLILKKTDILFSSPFTIEYNCSVVHYIELKNATNLCLTSSESPHGLINVINLRAGNVREGVSDGSGKPSSDGRPLMHGHNFSLAEIAPLRRGRGIGTGFLSAATERLDL